MQTYTYYSKETERPTTKLSVANVNQVFTAQTVLVKINTLYIRMDDGVLKAIEYTGLFQTDVTKVLRKANKVFALLEKKGVRLGALAEDFIGDAEFVLFTRNRDGSYNMSLKDFEFGLPQDIVNLRRATELARAAQVKYHALKHHVRLTEELN